jgi:tRNA pseudouridine13 synthase
VSAASPQADAGPATADWRGWALDPPRAHGGPLARATFKQSAGDFCVRERLGFAPDGGAAHVLLEVRKSGCNTLAVAGELARLAGCAARDVGFAGLKDRVAIATQWFSVPVRAAAADWQGRSGNGFEVIRAAAHSRKLRRGALAGNEFALVLREFDAAGAALETRLAAIAARGVPNYFGAQRFGRDGGNLESIARWCTTGRLPAGREPRAFVYSAARALVFNAVLGARVSDRSWDALLPGELVNLDGRNSYFAAATLDVTLAERLARHDIHPTGPLPGRGTAPAGIAGEREQAVLVGYPDLLARLEAAGLEAARRPLRVRPQALTATYDCAVLTLAFALPAGAYATAVVREIAATDSIPAEADDA